MTWYTTKSEYSRKRKFVESRTLSKGHLRTPIFSEAFWKPVLGAYTVIQKLQPELQLYVYQKTNIFADGFFPALALVELV